MNRSAWLLAPAPPDLWLGWLMSVGGMLLLVRELLRLGDQLTMFAVWWLLLAAGVAVSTVFLAVVGLVLPLGWLRRWWTVTAVSALGVQSLSIVARESTVSPDTTLFLTWGFEPVTCWYFVLLVHVWFAAALTVVSAILPSLSALLVLGYVPHPVLLGSVIYLSALTLIVLLSSLRSQLAELSDVEARARKVELRTIHEEESARAQRETLRVIHDEVLSTLAAATRLRGSPPPQLRRRAARALAIVGGTADFAPPATLSSAAAAEHLAGALRTTAPDTELSIVTGSGDVPYEVAEALRAALAEAARNSRRHAVHARRTAHISVGGTSVTARFADDGPGFAFDDIAPERMGVRESIIDRVRELDGGFADVQTGPRGTRVEIGWRR